MGVGRVAGVVTSSQVFYCPPAYSGQFRSETTLEDIFDVSNLKNLLWWKVKCYNHLVPFIENAQVCFIYWCGCFSVQRRKLCLVLWATNQSLIRRWWWTPKTKLNTVELLGAPSGRCPHLIISGDIYLGYKDLWIDCSLKLMSSALTKSHSA